MSCIGSRAFCRRAENAAHSSSSPVPSTSPPAVDVQHGHARPRCCLARKIHSDSASPAATATITISSFQGNQPPIASARRRFTTLAHYPVRVRLVLARLALTPAGFTHTCRTGVLAAAITASIPAPHMRMQTESPTWARSGRQDGRRGAGIAHSSEPTLAISGD